MMRRSLGLVPLVLVVGCGRSPSTPPSNQSAWTAPTAEATTTVAATQPSPALMEKLPHPPALAPSPVKVVGYPRSVGTGMNDPARWVGFTSDGSEYGYCAELGGRDPQVTSCETIARDGTTKLRSSDDTKGNFSPALMKELGAWRASSGLTKLRFDGDWSKWLAKPVKADWAYGDLTIWANPVGGDGVKINAVVKIGGSVDGEEPVYPVVLEQKPRGQGFTYHTAWVNDLSISPDGTEIGAVGGVFCMEWCDDFLVYRNGTGAFASLVYNDTGFRHHKKGEWARAADLFLKATWADPKAKLPPYNLACAWARLNDERTKDALAVAIERDPSAKARALTDADFESVKDSAWFRALTQ